MTDDEERELVPMHDLLRIVLLSRGPLTRDQLRTIFFGRGGRSSVEVTNLIGNARMVGAIEREPGGGRWTATPGWTAPSSAHARQSVQDV